MKAYFYTLAAAALFGQAQTPLKVEQNSGSTPGQVWLQEPRLGGQNWLKLKAQAMSADVDFTLPSTTGTSGQCLQTDGTGVLSWTTCGVGYATLTPGAYYWSQTITAPGSAGTHTITLTPGPLGVIATDTASQYWLSGTAGADEFVFSTGTGTCDGTGQTSCTIQVTTANSHTGTTTMRSSSAGAQEAVNAGPTSITLLYGNEAATWRACVNLNNHNVAFVGQGRGSSITLVTPGQRGVCKLTPGYLEFRNLSLIGDGTTTGIYAQASVSNAGSDRIDSSFFQSHAKAINHRVVSELWVTKNLFYGNTVDLETVNEVSNDQGGMVVSENNFLSDGTSGSKSVWFHGPGGSWFHKNAFTSARDSFYADGLMATVNTSGTAVTATDGRFYTGMVGGSYYINGVTYTIAAYVDSTHITLSTSAGTQTGVAFGQSTGQFHFEDNNFDNQNRTGVWFDGKIYFGGVNLRGNTFSNFFGTEKYTGILLTNPALDAVLIADNKFGNLAGTTYDNTGIGATTTGTNLAITGNTFLAHKYSIDLNLASTTNNTDTLISGNNFLGPDASGSVGVRLVNTLRAQVTANNIRNYRTGVGISGSSSAEIGVSGNRITCGSSATAVDVAAGTGVSVAATDIGTACSVGVAAASGTTVKIEGMTGTATTRTSAAGTAQVLDSVADGTARDNGTNNTLDVRSLSRYTSGTAAAGFAVRSPVVLQDAGGTGIIVGGTQWSWINPSTGVRTPQLDLLISKANTLAIGAQMDADLNWISKGSLYTSIGSVTGRFGADLNSGAGIGTFTNHPLSFYTDSAARWVLTSAGMIQPATTDTYDVGDLTAPKRVRGVYTKILDTALAGGTGDYVQTRKIQLFDNTGSATGASYWDLNVVMSGVGAGQNSKFYLRDNGGNTIWLAESIASGSAVHRTTISTDVLPDSTANARKLGLITQRWSDINADALDLTGAANITGNLSAAVINATGSPAYRVSGTTVINASRAATFTDLTIATASAPSVGDVWTATSTGGAGAWQAAGSSQWTPTGSDIYYNSTGSVGIGVAPSAPLHIYNTNAAIFMDGIGASAPNLLMRSSNGTLASPTATASGDRIGQFAASGYGTSRVTSGRVKFVAGSLHSATNAETRLIFSTTASGSTTATDRWEVSGAGNLLPITTNTVDIGSSTFKPKDLFLSGAADIAGNVAANTVNATGSPAYRVAGTTIISSGRDATFVGLTTSGAVSFSSSTITASSTFSSDLISTTTATYAIGSASVRWLLYASTANLSGILTLGSTITGDVTPTSNNTNTLGTSSLAWNAVHAGAITAYTSFLPASGVSTVDLGSATRRIRKGYVGDLDITGTIIPPSGTAFTGTKTVKGSTGLNCNLDFSVGILLTSSTC
jgi:hypothetical protein